MRNDKVFSKYLSVSRCVTQANEGKNLVRKLKFDSNFLPA